MKVCANQLASTIERLERRVKARLPDADLVRVCAALRERATSAPADIRHIQRNSWFLRLIVTAFLFTIVATILLELRGGTGVAGFARDLSATRTADLVQAIESLMNAVIMAGAAILFLVTVETRIRRNRVVTLVNQLRSIAHLIDLHQLSKDPVMLQPNAQATTASPTRPLDSFLTARYLVYCSELLSLTSKVGFIYVQEFPDPVAVAAMNDLEQLATGLSTKIWQKIDVLESAG